MRHHSQRRTEAKHERVGGFGLSVSALPGGSRAPRAGPAAADEPVAHSARRAAAPLVCRAGGESARAGRRAPGVPDHRIGRADDPPRAAGTGRLVGRGASEAPASARRWPAEGRKKDPAILTVLQAVVEPETAGDPMSDQKWARSSLRQLSRRLVAAGHPASPPTVGRLLDDLGYALHVNAKKLEASAARPGRNAQFEYIAEQRRAFTLAGLPQISVDTKKKELIGNFRNGGRTWSQAAEAVNVHDFRQDALGRAVPYGIYDLTHNRGTVYLGTSADTPRFAVDALTC